MKAKALFTICLLLLGATALQAQELQKFKDEKGKYGYKDENEKEVIAPKYNDAYNFSEGLACVNIGGVPCKPTMENGFSNIQGGKWGFIDKTGKEVIPVKYILAYSFSEGLATVALNGKFGFIDKTGKEVIPFIYEAVPNWHFKRGKILVMLNGKRSYIDKTGKEVQ